MTKKKKNRKSDGYTMAFLGVGMSVAIELVVATSIGYYLGKWVDDKMGWDPWGMLTSLILFMSVSIAHSIIVLNHLTDRMESDD